MNEEKDGYKLLIKNAEGKLVSYLTKSDANCEYGIDKTTERPVYCGPLAVFDHLADVKNFLDEEGLSGLQEANTSIKLFVCRYIPSNDRTLYYYSVYKNDYISASCIIDGIQFADKITLVREIPISFSFRKDNRCHILVVEILEETKENGK